MPLPKLPLPLLLLSLSPLPTSLLVTPVVAEELQPTITCRYDPESGVPNPLGMRTLLTLEEQSGSTAVVYERLPSMVGGPANPTMTLTRRMFFFETSIDQTRQLLLNYPDYYNTLVGEPDPAGFGPVNDTLRCQAGDVANLVPPPSLPQTLSPQSAPLPASPHQASTVLSPNLTTELPDLSGPAPTSVTVPLAGNIIDTLATLPDGNYRYQAGEATPDAAPDAAPRRQGDAIFLFRKTGDQIVGYFTTADQTNLCINGRVSGNVITGTALSPTLDPDARGEDFSTLDPDGFLQVRRSVTVANRTRYDGAILDLNRFTRINAGRALPPTACE